MLGAGCRLPEDTLRFLEAMPTRIFVHNDAPGLAAAKRWAKQLAGAGAHVSGFTFDGLIRSDGAPVKDLCDLASISSESWEENRELIETAMFF
jgi:hypothetical protein